MILTLTIVKNLHSKYFRVALSLHRSYPPQPLMNRKCELRIINLDASHRAIEGSNNAMDRRKCPR
jgi:hypothetical protein